MRIVNLIIGFMLFTGLALGTNISENLRQSLSNTAEEQQPQILIQLFDASIKTEPETALNYAIEAEKLAVKYKLYPETGIARKQQGNYYYQKKDYTKAIKIYRLALAAAQKTNDNELLGDIFNNLGQAHTHINDYAKAREFLQTALTYRRKLPSREDEITSLNNLGQVYWETQNYQKAADQYLAAAKHLENTSNLKLASATYNNLGNAYVKTGNTAKALDAYIKSLDLKEQYGTPAELASANLNIGNLFYTNNNYSKALVHYDIAHRIASDLGDSTGVATIKRNLGVVHNALKNFDQALAYHQSSLSYFKQKSMNQDVAKTLNNIGNLYEAQKMYPQALDFYQQSLAIKNDLQDTEGLAVTHKNIGQIYLLMKDYQPALQHTLTAIALSKQLPDRILLHGNYLQLSKIYGAMGDYKNGYLTLQDYWALDASLYQKEGQSALAEMIARFGVQEKTKELSVLKTTHQAQKEKLARASRDRWLLILLSVFTLVVAITLSIFYRLKQREVKKRIAVQLELEVLNQKLETLNAELESKIHQAIQDYKTQQQIIIQKSKLESLGVMAAGMAHEINQPLSAVTMSINNIRIKAQKGELNDTYLSDKIRKVTDDIQRIKNVIEHVRQFSRDQINSKLERIDIHQTLRNAVELITYDLAKHQIGLSMQFSSQSLFTVGNKFKLEQVFLNLLSNARDAILEKVRGAGDTHPEFMIEISTSIQEDSTAIVFHDNGIGMSESNIDKIFDPFYTTKSPEKGTGLGLSISYGIIREMGGNIMVSSELGKYTKITVSLSIL